MKLAINLLPPEPEIEGIKARKRMVTMVSGVLLLVFLIANLAIFGFYWFLNKNTAATLAAIKREEAKIISFAPTERLYRSLTAKLSFLSNLWQKKAGPEEAIDFAQALLVPKVTLTRLSFGADGLTTLSLKTTDSDGLENFLNGVSEKEKTGQIKDIKITSTNRDKDGGYNFSLSFKFLRVE